MRQMMGLNLKSCTGYWLNMPVLFFVLTLSAMACAQASSSISNIAAIQAITTLLLNDCGPRNQETFDGDVDISNQSDVNALSHLAIIDGDLRITSDSNLDFSPLNGLVEVTGTIWLEDNPAQTQFNGFDCLREVDALLMYRNPALEEIVGFNQLETIHGYLEITNSDTTTTAYLRRISGFTSLQSLRGGIIFYRMPFLVSIPHFSALKTIGATLDFNRLTSLSDIPGFVNLVSVGRDLIIRRNNRLERVSGFDRLTHSNVGRNIEIYSNLILDCGRPSPGFLPATRSDGNLVDC